MIGELEFVAEKLRQAQVPEALFGDLSGKPPEQLKAAERIYKKLALKTHPDRNGGQEEEASEAFQKLQKLWEEARKKIASGTYGNRSVRAETLKITTRRGVYVVGEQLAQGDICNLYLCTYDEGGDEKKAILKVARSARDNDLVQNEARVLKKLGEGRFEKFRPYVPKLIDTFQYKEGSSPARQANVLSWLEGLYSLKEVRQAYPEGVDPRDLAWMWRRLVVALGFAHNNGIVHGAVLPSHILIHPEKHGLVLVDWSYAVCDPEESGERIRAISSEYEQWYPEDVLAKEVPIPGLDIYMGAQSMVYLLGGDPVTGFIPDRVPKPLRAFFRGCLLKNPKRRPQDAWGLKEEFDELIERLWGKRRFHPFHMPRKN